MTNYEFSISNHPSLQYNGNVVKRKLIFLGLSTTGDELTVNFSLSLYDNNNVLIQEKDIVQWNVVSLTTSNNIPVDIDGNILKDESGNYNFASENFYKGERDYLLEKGLTTPLYSLLEYYVGKLDSEGFFNQ